MIRFASILISHAQSLITIAVLPPDFFRDEIARRKDSRARPPMRTPRRNQSCPESLRLPPARNSTNARNRKRPRLLFPQTKDAGLAAGSDSTQPGAPRA